MGQEVEIIPEFQDLAVIVGVRLSRDRPDCYTRLKAWLKWHRSAGFTNFIVLDSSESWTATFPIRTLCRRYHTTYENVPMAIHSPSAIRNRGMQIAASQKLSCAFFVDVDVLGQSGSVKALRRDIRTKTSFNWYPVQFTSSNDGVKRMVDWSRSSNKVFNGDIYQIGYATGIQFMTHDAWQKLDGYDESFVGYGCEDIDLIHRATAIFGSRLPLPHDDPYFEDFRTTELSSYRGYRKWMLDEKISVPKSDMWIHFHHPRRHQSDYFSSRKRNDVILKKSMRQFDTEVIRQTYFDFD